MTIDDIRSDFALLDDWEDRYRYVIELGRALPALDDSKKTNETKVRGCASQVWLITRRDADGTLHMEGASDAHIVQGLIAVLFAIYDGKTPEALLATDAAGIFAELGLKDHLSPQRSNGLQSMIARIRSDAERNLAA